MRLQQNIYIKKMVFIRYAREKIHVSFFGLVLGESEDERDKQNREREREREGDDAKPKLRKLQYFSPLPMRKPMRAEQCCFSILKI
jgi:hypothetical protein